MGLSKSAQTLWEYAGYALAAYTAYQKVKEIQSIKNDIFPYLSPDQQTLLAKYVGAPAPVQPLSTTASVVAPAPVAGTLAQVRAGT